MAYMHWAQWLRKVLNLCAAFILGMGLTLVPARIVRAAQFYVSILADNGAGSLRNAVLLANASSGADDIVITAPGPILLTSGEILVLEDVTITGLGAQQTAINGTASGRIFNIAVPGGNVILQDMALVNGYVPTDGGAILSNANLNLQNVDFVSNYSERDGGAVWVDGNLTITGGTFVSNDAERNGGGFYVEEGRLAVIQGTQFQRNTAAFEGGAGVAANDASVRDSAFLTNTAQLGGGIKVGHTLLMTSTLFRANRTIGPPVLRGTIVPHNPNILPSNGGGAWVKETAAIVSSQFYTNTSFDSGGGLYVLSGPAFISGTTFAGNYTPMYGAGMVNGSSNTVLVNSTFERNRSNWWGGAIYAHAGAVHDTGGTYISNTAKNNGGAVNVYNGIAALTNTLFISNASVLAEGGGIFVDSQSGAGPTGALYATNATFIGNTATGNGGGARARRNATVSGSTFEGNTCGSAGGGLFMFQGTLTITDTDFRGNKAPNGGGATVMANTTFAMKGGSFVTNTVTNGGGGFYVHGGSGTISGTTFLSNTAGSYGGGMTNNAVGGMTLQNVTFISNTATYNGGGINMGSGTVTVLGGEFTRNTTDGSGGAMQSSETALTIYDARFNDNEADQFGGGLFVSGVSMYISGTQILENDADFGGGLYLTNTQTTIVRSGLLSNTATSSGGGLYAYAGTLDVRAAVFTANQAHQTGGGAAHEGALSGQYINTLFARNNSVHTGDALSIISAGVINLRHLTIAYEPPTINLASTGRDGHMPSRPTGTAIFVSMGTVHITNTIIAHYPTGIGETAPAIVSEDYNLFFGATTPTTSGVLSGTHSFSADPQFMDEPNGDYRIKYISPAVNAGKDVGVTLDAFGNPRPQGGGFDIGFHESTGSRVRLPMVMR